MTYRQLLKEIIAGGTDLDKDVKIRIRHRAPMQDGEIGSVTHVRTVVATGFFHSDDHIAIEFSDINKAPKEEC